MLPGRGPISPLSVAGISLIVRPSASILVAELIAAESSPVVTSSLQRHDRPLHTAGPTSQGVKRLDGLAVHYYISGARMCGLSPLGVRGQRHAGDA
ncbi:hypothetical protein BDZ91DRAFT_715596 [Kalaharituber pfeilii]|nr:hypothetical protein BDZ91DRAFT_715596 [Kalaharituber pfeilii]